MTSLNITRMRRLWEWYKEQQQTSCPKHWIPVEPAKAEKEIFYCKKLWEYLIHDQAKFNSKT